MCRRRLNVRVDAHIERDGIDRLVVAASCCVRIMRGATVRACDRTASELVWCRSLVVTCASTGVSLRV